MIEEEMSKDNLPPSYLRQRFIKVEPVEVVFVTEYTPIDQGSNGRDFARPGDAVVLDPAYPYVVPRERFLRMYRPEKEVLG